MSLIGKAPTVVPMGLRHQHVHDLAVTRSFGQLGSGPTPLLAAALILGQARDFSGGSGASVKCRATFKGAVQVNRRQV